MQYLAALALSSLVAVVPASATPTPSPFMGTITAPTPDATISDTFAFAYSIDNWCEEGYNNFKVFASQSASAPTVADLDSNGDVPNALASWGDYTVANFGLTPLGTQPPSSLEMPSLDDIDTSDCVPMFITVVETFNGCPGHVVQEIGTTSVPTLYCPGA